MYRRLPLLRLAQLIAYDSDREALDELHNNRTVFAYREERWLRLVEFVDRLKQARQGWRWCDRRVETLDRAYDLTISKFSRLPTQADREMPTCKKTQGPDCRYYFEAFVRHVANKGNTPLGANEIEMEMQAAGYLQNHVVRHFRLSCLECRRSQRGFTRKYLWKVDDGVLPVWLPSEIPGHQCAAWLKAHIPEVDARRAGERNRVQALVDGWIRRRQILSLDELDPEHIAAEESASSPSLEERISVNGLAAVVAQEKAENIEQLRPAIRQLGKESLKRLIHQIFDALADGRYDAAVIADGAGISRATFSRFAGIRWSSTSSGMSSSRIPDLWLNTAQTLAGHRHFEAAARAAGVFDRVEKILCMDPAQNGTTDNEP